MKGKTDIEIESLVSLPEGLIDFCLAIKKRLPQTQIFNQPNPNFPLIRIYLCLFESTQAFVFFNALQSVDSHKPNQMVVNNKFVDVEFRK